MSLGISGAVCAPVLPDDIALRAASVSWTRVADELSAVGVAQLGPLLSEDECRTLVAAYEAEQMYRSRVVMQRYSFGRGEYKYYQYPLPSLVESVRQSIYPHLVPIANVWAENMKLDERYPDNLDEQLRRCHDAGQCRPTPLILRYDAGDYNCLHQDLYGEHRFLLQVAVLLSRPGRDFAGGELVVTEQRPRRQSRVHVVPLAQGHAAVFAVHQRPVCGTRGFYRVTSRHGVSEVRSGRRHALGLIFHDAT